MILIHPLPARILVKNPSFKELPNGRQDLLHGGALWRLFAQRFQLLRRAFSKSMMLFGPVEVEKSGGSAVCRIGPETH